MSQLDSAFEGIDSLRWNKNQEMTQPGLENDSGLSVESVSARSSEETVRTDDTLNDAGQFERTSQHEDKLALRTRRETETS